MNPIELELLRPCPFCNTKRLHLYGKADGVYIHCECGTRGPCGCGPTAKLRAFTLWNKREAAVNSNDLLAPLRDQLRVQGKHGNWNCNSYMLGMYNGLECALATLEHREPQYRRKPDDGWLDDRIPPGFVPTMCEGPDEKGQR